MKSIRVLLVDDHAVVRSGLGAVLAASDDMDLVGEAGEPLGILGEADGLVEAAGLSLGGGEGPQR